MTRYGFAIKALPQGSKPFGEEDDDENEETAGTEQDSLKNAESGVSDSEPAEEPPEDLPEDSAPSEPADTTAPPTTDTPPEEGIGGAEDPAAAPAPPEDDSRPWAGDMYDEGDETTPEDAYCAYTGSNGEQAWLDRAPDGTLTGWVRDETGQVWRYTDPDAWATDVDGAQMTRTHGPEGEDAPADPAADPAAPADPAQPPDRGVQDSMFQGQ